MNVSLGGMYYLKALCF